VSVLRLLSVEVCVNMDRPSPTQRHNFSPHSTTHPIPTPFTQKYNRSHSLTHSLTHSLLTPLHFPFYTTREQEAGNSRARDCLKSVVMMRLLSGRTQHSPRVYYLVYLYIYMCVCVFFLFLFLTPRIYTLLELLGWLLLLLLLLLTGPVLTASAAPNRIGHAITTHQNTRTPPPPHTLSLTLP
jgi:hypothetical protein